MSIPLRLPARNRKPDFDGAGSGGSDGRGRGAFDRRRSERFVTDVLAVDTPRQQAVEHRLLRRWRSGVGWQASPALISRSRQSIARARQRLRRGLTEMSGVECRELAEVPEPVGDGA